MAFDGVLGEATLRGVLRLVGEFSLVDDCTLERGDWDLLEHA